MSKLRYLVVTPPYTINSGGPMFLHSLVDSLRSLGVDAALWPMGRSPIRDPKERLRAFYNRTGSKSIPFAIAPNATTPIAPDIELPGNSIVVYPEVILGNPLSARNVVRWLLYRPGLRHPYKFGANEMFFRAGEMSDLPELTGGAPDLFLWSINPLYKNENRPNRKGACYQIRKGEGKPIIPETESAISIDGRSHAEIAEIFNQCEYFYSYDEASFYSQYAAICGCISVVVPGLYSSRAEWVAQHPIASAGVAYGLEDIEHARNTRHLVLENLLKHQASGMDSVNNFVKLTKERFFPIKH